MNIFYFKTLKKHKLAVLKPYHNISYKKMIPL